jgi:F-type H+-transporting ATPase subunit delta
MARRQEEAMALAGVYAESLLMTSDEQRQTDEVAAELADLVAYMDREPDFDRFLTAESVDADARRASLEKLFRGKMNDLLLNLLQVMNNRNRMELVRPVQRQVGSRLEERHHQQEIVVETALPLTDEMRQEIRERVGRRIGKEALLTERLRPELIGGVVIHIGDVQIDGSVASRIRAVHRRMLERATEEIHNNGRYLMEGNGQDV